MYDQEVQFLIHREYMIPITRKPELSYHLTTQSICPAKPKQNTSKQLQKWLKLLVLK